MSEYSPYLETFYKSPQDSSPKRNLDKIVGSALALPGLVAASSLAGYISLRHGKRINQQENYDQGIFEQERIGQHGSRLIIKKLATLAPNPDGSLDNLSLLTRLLRKTGLDELPQLANVLEGEVSLVGPRIITPQALNKIHRYAEQYNLDQKTLDKWHDLRSGAIPGWIGIHQSLDITADRDSPDYALGVIESELNYMTEANLTTDLRAIGRAALAIRRQNHLSADNRPQATNKLIDPQVESI